MKTLSFPKNPNPQFLTLDHERPPLIWMWLLHLLSFCDYEPNHGDFNLQPPDSTTNHSLLEGFALSWEGNQKKGGLPPFFADDDNLTEMGLLQSCPATPATHLPRGFVFPVALGFPEIWILAGWRRFLRGVKISLFYCSSSLIHPGFFFQGLFFCLVWDPGSWERWVHGLSERRTVERGEFLAGFGVVFGAGWIWWSEVGSWRALSLLCFILLVPRFYLSDLLPFVFALVRSFFSCFFSSLYWIWFCMCCNLEPDLLVSLADIALLRCDPVIDYLIPEPLLFELASLTLFFAWISSLSQSLDCFSLWRFKSKKDIYSEPMMTLTNSEKIASETHQMFSLAPNHRSMTIYEHLRNIDQFLYLINMAFALLIWSQKYVLMSIVTPCNPNSCSQKDKNYQMNLHSEIASQGPITWLPEPLSFLNYSLCYLNSIFDVMNLLHEQFTYPSDLQVSLACDVDRMNIGWIWCFYTILNPRMIIIESKIINLDLHFFCVYWWWCSQVHAARITIGVHIFKKKIKIKSCNGKRSNRKNHYLKPYPQNNLDWNPKFVKIGS